MKTMLKVVFMVCAAAALQPVARGAEVIWGEFNTSLGYLAGQQAQGNRVTVMGAGAGGQSYGDSCSDFFGGASGAHSSRLYNTVGIGYHSLRYSSNMSNVVAIGTSALEERDGLRDATYLNGQFYAEKAYGIYLTHDKEQNKSNAPLFYTNGVWTMNGNLVVKGQIALADPNPSTDFDITGIYDYYLDANQGDDMNTGLISRPKRTFEGVVKAIEETWTGTSQPTVGVYPGTYTYITNIAVGAVFKAVAGPSDTVIVPKSVTVGQGWWDEKTYESCFIYSDSDQWVVFDGFKFRGFSAGGTASKSPGSFNYVWFRNCAFVDAEPRITRYAPIFYGCVLENCTADRTVKPFTTSNIGGNWVVYCNLLLGSEVYDSILDFGNADNATKDNSPRLAHQTLFANSFIGMEKCYSAITYPGRNYTTVLGSVATVMETTVKARDTNLNHFKDVDGSSWFTDLQPATNSLIAIGTEARDAIYGLSNKAIAYDNLELDENYQPVDIGYTFYGYKSENNRGLRNSIISDVAAVLDQHDLPSASLALKARIQPKVAIPRPSISGTAVPRPISVIENPDEDDDDPDDPQDPVYPDPTTIKAVIVGEGNSQIATPLSLDGDVSIMTGLLQGRVTSVTTLKNEQATYAAVSNALESAVTADLCIFYYTGHGGRQRFADTGSEESDGYDEYLCLYDRMMRDNDIWNIISKSNGRVFLIFDCCYSETMFRVPNPSQTASFGEPLRARFAAAKPKGIPTFSMLCWSAGPENMLTYTVEGHDYSWFTKTINDHFSATATYDAIWTAVSTDTDLLRYETPKRTVGGTGFVNRTIFR